MTLIEFQRETRAASFERYLRSGSGLWVPDNRVSEFVRESLLIAGWVALWKPIDVFLYEWWPIRVEAVLSDRLSRMVVRVTPSQAR